MLAHTLSLWSSVNGIDLLAFALGALIMFVLYEVVLHRARRRFDRRLDETWDRAYDEGWMDGCRTGRSIDRAIGSIMEEAEAHDE